MRNISAALPPRANGADAGACLQYALSAGYSFLTFSGELCYGGNATQLAAMVGGAAGTCGARLQSGEMATSGSSGSGATYRLFQPSALDAAFGACGLFVQRVIFLRALSRLHSPACARPHLPPPVTHLPPPPRRAAARQLSGHS